MIESVYEKGWKGNKKALPSSFDTVATPFFVSSEEIIYLQTCLSNVFLSYLERRKKVLQEKQPSMQH